MLISLSAEAGSENILCLCIMCPLESHNVRCVCAMCGVELEEALGHLCSWPRAGRYALESDAKE